MLAFGRWPNHVRFVVDKVALGQAFLRVPVFSAVSLNVIYTDTPYTFSLIFTYKLFLTEGQREESCGTFLKISAVSEIGEQSMKKYFLVSCLVDLRQYLVYTRAP